MSNQQHTFALEFLTKLPQLEPGALILDIGAGPGYQTQWLREQGYDARAVDLAVPTVEVPYIHADAGSLPMADASIDAIWSHHAIEHIRDPLGALLEMSRVLKPGGYLFLTVPQIDGVISNGHINSYDMPLVVYHLAMCGFDTAAGHFGKFRSHLRAAVRKIDTPDTLDTDVRSLWARGRLPESCWLGIKNTGRFSSASLETKWFDGKMYK